MASEWVMYVMSDFWHEETFFCLCGDAPVTAAEERARRGLDSAELSRAGRVSALGDERMQVSDMNGLLSLMLNGNDRVSH